MSIDKLQISPEMDEALTEAIEDAEFNPQGRTKDEILERAGKLLKQLQEQGEIDE